MVSKNRLNELIAKCIQQDEIDRFDKRDLEHALAELRWRRTKQLREPVQRIRDVCLVFAAIVVSVWFLFFA